MSDDEVDGWHHVGRPAKQRRRQAKISWERASRTHYCLQHRTQPDATTEYTVDATNNLEIAGGSNLLHKEHCQDILFAIGQRELGQHRRFVGRSFARKSQFPLKGRK